MISIFFFLKSTFLSLTDWKIEGNFVERSKSFKIWDFFFPLGFLSRPFTSHITPGEGGVHFFNSSLQVPHASQTFRH